METGGKFQAHYHGSPKDHSKNWELLRISDTLVSILLFLMVKIRFIVKLKVHLYFISLLIKNATTTSAVSTSSNFTNTTDDNTDADTNVTITNTTIYY